jgi:CRP-like cAMP-binding protein
MIMLCGWVNTIVECCIVPAQASKEDQRQILNAGETFGSEGLVEGTPLPYSVISRTPLQLLIIGPEAFAAIFISREELFGEVGFFLFFSISE